MLLLKKNTECKRENEKKEENSIACEIRRQPHFQIRIYEILLLNVMKDKAEEEQTNTPADKSQCAELSKR